MKKYRVLLHVSTMFDYICGPTLHDIMVMTTLNFMMTVAMLVVAVVKKPIRVVDEKNLSDLR